MSVLILNMSITGSIVILFVLFARLILKKAPKIFSYALWAVVLFRLLCPVSIATDFSLLRLFDTAAVENTQHTTTVKYIPYDAVLMPDREVYLPMTSTISETLSEMHSTEHADLDIYPLAREYTITSIIWILDIIVLSVYSLVSYILLRWKLCSSSCIERMNPEQWKRYWQKTEQIFLLPLDTALTTAVSSGHLMVRVY